MSGGGGVSMVKGHGLPPSDPGHRGGCVMDWAVWRLTEGQEWADSHPCFNRAVTYAAQRVNDLLDDAGRDRLERDFGGAGGRIDRARACRDPETENRINRRLALWCARRVEHLSDDPRVKACNDATERFLAGEITAEELRKARAAAASYAAAASAASAANSYAAYADPSAASAANSYAAYAAASAANSYAAYADRNDRLLDLLSDLLDAHEKIAADEGALGDLWTWADYCQAAGS